MARQQRTRPGRAARWPLVALAVVLVGGGVAATLLSSGDDEREPARPDGDGGRDLVTATTEVPSRQVDGPLAPIGRPPVAYRLSYRVEGFAPDGAVIDLEHRTVRLPFASRVESVAAEDEANITFLQIADLGVLQTGQPVALTAEPSIAPGSVHVSPDVVADVLEWRHEVRTVVDRDCQVVRAGGPIDVVDLQAPESADTWADLCVDEDGLVLQEDWYVDRDLFRRRTAIELDLSPALDDDLFTPTGERVEGVPGGSFVELTPDSRSPGVTHFELAAPPAGFTLTGRWAFSPPRADDQLSTLEVPRVAVIVDVYEDGDGGALFVANGGTANRSALFTSGSAAETVDLSTVGLGTADVLRGLRQSEVRASLPGGRFVRVYGSLAVDDLVSLARTLQANDTPGQVTPLDG